ncbi:hypothetical protein DL96DRAFT_1813979 [Flagelloscypha sp. PMI_526]|nr:hypothetical protein DL96DRAFT_1813979 [Flagelloscypha sp. PMI_526]
MQNYPVRVNPSITKADAPRALVLDKVIQEGGFIIENTSFHNDAKLGTDVKAEFETLDPTVQEASDQSVSDRDLNEKLLFIPGYCEFQEQDEYVKCFNRASKFIQA